MKTTTISYRELADRVGDVVLFNNATAYDVDKDWVYGLITSPHMQDKIDELDQQAMDDEATNFGENPIEHSITDFDIYQTFAITPEGAKRLYNHTSEIISYSEKLDIFLWHVTHFGTSWSGVHTEWHEWEASEDDPSWYIWDTEELCKQTMS